MFFIGLIIFFVLVSFLRAQSSRFDRSANNLVSSIGGVFIILALLYIFGMGLFGIALIALPWLMFSSFSSPNRQKDSFKFDYKFYSNAEDFFKQAGQQSSHSHYQHRSDPGRSEIPLADAARTLGVPITATEAQVKSAYRKLMQQHHPDKGGDIKMATKINLAKDAFLKKFK
jgi:dolichyl-phosphate-mannose--protein O-mannosyl transferase